MTPVQSFLPTASVLAVLCALFIPGHRAIELLNLYEGAVCQKGTNGSPDHVCRRSENCPTLIDQLSRYENPKMCSFIGSTPVVCCTPSSEIVADVESAVVMSSHESIADQMCRNYTLLATTIRITGGIKAEPREFPHMALLGYGKFESDEKTWGCGGSLISNRWILSAAHCAISSGEPVSWARLGELNIRSTNDDSNPRDYEIDNYVLHPNYNRSMVYHDIGLFRLATVVLFNEYVRPICLNTNSSLTFQSASAIGWGRTSSTGPTSPDLLKVNMQEVEVKKCNTSYTSSSNERLSYGILSDRMMCASDLINGSDTCRGDSGGPLQVQIDNHSSMYTQVGITSFGKTCGSKDYPGIYTKVSFYIKWIESIVWLEK